MLSAEIAQEIVERTMKILPYNINVMNEKGMIIGSGTRDRIGTAHEIARQAIVAEEAIEITSELADELEGVRPGINLPITFQGTIVGTIGITGDPRVVRPFGELVKMTAEIILDQSFLLNQMQLDERITRELVNEWIRGEATSSKRFIERAKALAINLEIARGAVIIAIPERELSKRVKINHIEEIVKRDLGEQDVLSVLEGRLVILIHANTEEELNDRAKAWVHAFKTSVTIAVGSLQSDYHAAHTSYIEALHTSIVMEKLEDSMSFATYQDKSLERLLYKLFAGEKVVGTALSKELVSTLQTYVEHDGSIQEAADALFIHRNTMSYRLERIEILTGKNPKKLSDLFYLYATVVLAEKLSN
ncbi:helix-turn-helix domain-containing protein [Paenalkalicoccus suaedae]|uniref:Helix-turn-helix domain-containing protein n=1 Tax=Paenalkalicoccus suaedae TaxID=2592382 RepID=A0A859FC99_9BACI|nr:sugar diacid recognition domain-containing protein [Paenalkalicoccus suaedae]QKS70570.1 helix-turn-helix domain-containing protein [Paenalkalicoccus suaedae]